MYIFHPQFVLFILHACNERERRFIHRNKTLLETGWNNRLPWIIQFVDMARKKNKINNNIWVARTQTHTPNESEWHKHLTRVDTRSPYGSQTYAHLRFHTHKCRFGNNALLMLFLFGYALLYIHIYYRIRGDSTTSFMFFGCKCVCYYFSGVFVYHLVWFWKRYHESSANLSI